MDYQIKSGDCLWNIVKENYNCASNKEIQDTINQIAKANDIKDPNLIYANTQIVLPASAMAKFKEQNKGDSFSSTTRADNFDEWTNSEENYDKNIKGEKVDDFKMFDFNASTYSSDLKEFSQEYVNKYDQDKDGQWNQSEFINMATNGKDSYNSLVMAKVTNTFLSLFGIKNQDLQTKSDQYDLLQEQFNTFNFDGDGSKINAGEFASVLYSSDLDLDNYAKTGDVASSIDGKLDYVNYQTYPMLDTESDGYKTIHKERSDFYNNFYA